MTQISRMAGLPNRAELRTQVAKAAREAEKLGKSSFGWAFLLDERQDERERGITADVGSGEASS